MFIKHIELQHLACVLKSIHMEYNTEVLVYYNIALDIIIHKVH